MDSVWTIGSFYFFTISGYLVSASWERDPNILRFFQRRLVRILPGLVICTILTIFVLGPIFTTLPMKEYFGNPHTRGYLQNIGLHIVYYLPGVFEHNKIGNAVNGSLWSLPVEFLMYVVIALIGVLQGNRWTLVILATASAATCLMWAQVSTEMLVFYNFDLRQAFICGTYFWIGACLQRFNLKRHLTPTAGMLALFAMMSLEPWPSQLALTSWVLLPIVVLAFGFAYSPWLRHLTRSGDYSYGIYIYAFPIQQSVVYMWPNIGIGNYLLICTACTYLMAMLSWHLVERRALNFKPRNPSPTLQQPTNVASA
ncbi:MAG: acyltransferase [Hydrogenophaga sp.]|uniref:acyltransferase family protein n=1 Tax=Hydrogenophaga sp. TaxID=1904254 RepID=UPI0027190287|nr:acyltransferase [Hydrogenophaga sp.]MDO9605234.1 acyltransferase [Hydrogenophaga sp.]MDP2163548.1 acyltransferase [Hydrogenophaga sp.]MDP3474831.1 acyltransferase [Hydrogenophaga sp.]